MSYSSNESGPLFIKDTFSDSDMEQSSNQQRHSNECICKEKVKTVMEIFEINYPNFCYRNHERFKCNGVINYK